MEETKRIGDYLLGQTIGQGTFGKVKLAIHQPTKQKVAVKILVKSLIVQQSDVERVSRQIQILKTLRHPNLIQLYQIIQTNQQYFLIMEYAEGGQLFNYIVLKQRLPEKQAANILLQILNGVQYCHKIGVVHRDLKPQNLLFSNKTIKIADFGLSNTYKNEEKLSTPCGSPCYAAPEMIENKKYYGLDVDIWSCGIIMYALICGFLPFEEQNNLELYKKIVQGEFIIPRWVSTQASDLLHGILNTDPVKRLNINQIRRHRWFYNTYCQIEQGIIVGKQQLQSDPYILEQLSSFGFDLNHARKCLEMNRHNNITTTYYLLCNKHIRNGGQLIKYKKKINIKQHHINKFHFEKKQRSYSTTRDTSISGNHVLVALSGKAIPNQKLHQVNQQNKVFPKLQKKQDDLQSLKQIGTNQQPLENYNKQNYNKQIILQKQRKSKEQKESKKTEQFVLYKEFEKIKSFKKQNSPLNYRDLEHLKYSVDKNRNDVSQRATEKVIPKDQNIAIRSARLSKNQDIIHKIDKQYRKTKEKTLRSNKKQQYKRKQSDSIQQLLVKIHNGPFNVGCLFKKPAKYLMLEIEKVLFQIRLICKYINKYEIRVQKQSLKFEVGLFEIKNVEGLLLVKFKKIFGDQSKLVEIEKYIISNLKR